MKQISKVYILCYFSHDTSDQLSPHDIIGVFFSKEVLEQEKPELKFNWIVPRTSQAIAGVAKNLDGDHFFILVRHMVANDEISPVAETGELWDEYQGGT